MGQFILPLAQTQSLEIILDSSFSHTPHPVSQKILLSSPSEQIQNLTASHHLCHPCLAQATTLVHLDSCNILSSGLSLAFSILPEGSF